MQQICMIIENVSTHGAGTTPSIELSLRTRREEINCKDELLHFGVIIGAVVPPVFEEGVSPVLVQDRYT